MGKEGGLMSVREADRAAVIRDVVEKRLGRREAAERLGIGVRQIKRLARRYRERGAAGLVSGHRGKRPNNAIDAAVRREVVDLVRKRYRDFGPTFAHEKLVEEHGYRLSVETLRRWMIADGLWRAKTRREVRTHQSRPRRECVGDLVQIDGSATVLREGRELPVRLLAEGEEPIPLEDGKTVRGHVDAAKAEQRARPAYKPPPDHPWRRPFKPAASVAAGG